LSFKSFFLFCALAATVSLQAYSAEPVITSVSPNPVLGTGADQSFCVNGSGFTNGSGLTVRLTGPAGQMDVPVNFFNPNQLCLTFNFGSVPGDWTARAINGDRQLSNVFFFSVIAPGHGANPHLALPHFVFGGVWYSAIYLSNTTNALESVPLTFMDDAGAPLFVPLAGIGSVWGCGGLGQNAHGSSSLAMAPPMRGETASSSLANCW